MNTAAVTVPEDCEALRYRVRELESLLSEARCAKLEYKLQDLLRRLFGAKNEKLNPAQRVLFGLSAQMSCLRRCRRPRPAQRPQACLARNVAGVDPSQSIFPWFVR